MDLLENVQVGDKLIKKNSWSTSVVTVDRISKNYVIAGNSRFRISDGLCTSSDSWNKPRVYPATETDIAKIKKEIARSKLIFKCRDIDFNILSTSQLEQILEIAKSTT